MDRRQLALESLAALEQAAVVMEAMQADLAAGGREAGAQGRIDGIVLGDQEPGGHHAVARFDLQQGLDRRESGGALHVVGEDVREAVAAGPEPEERSAAAPRRAQALAQRRFSPVDQDRLDRPAREVTVDRVPAPQPACPEPAERDLQPARNQRLEPVEQRQRAR